jgi:Uma2 family endonuclease
MSVEQLDITLPDAQWDVEEPRPRRWSPVEFDFMVESGLVSADEAYLMGGRVRRSQDHELRRWSVDDYARMGELGLLAHDQRVELVFGEVFGRTPQRTYHATAFALASKALDAALPPGCHLRHLAPLVLRPYSEPEPDLSLVAGEIRDYVDAHPSRALMVLEVADTTLRLDLREKARLYASVGVPDYWVTDIRNRCVHVLREPVPDATQRHGFRYASVRKHLPGETITPLAAPDASIAVEDLLP